MTDVRFWCVPRTCHTGLESVYTDYIICQHRWVKFITRMQSTWRECVINVSISALALWCDLRVPF